MQHLPRTHQAAKLPPIETPPSALLLVGITAVCALVIAVFPVTTSALLLCAFGIGLAVLVRPWIGLVALAVVLPWAAARPVAIGSATMDGADLLLGLTALAWLAQGAVNHRVVVPRLPLIAPLLLFAGSQAVALVGATSYNEALPELLKWLQVVVLYVVVAAALPARRAGWLLAGLLAAAASQAALGIYQFLTQSGPEQFVLLGRYLRAYGTFRQPNPFAGYLGLAAPLAVSLAIWAWTAALTAKRQRRPAGQADPGRALLILLPTAAGLITAGLLVSWSRGAWLALAAALAAVVLAHARRAAPALIVAAAVLLLAVAVIGPANLLPPFVVERIGDLQDYVGLSDVARTEVTDANFAVMERLAHWQAAINMWTARPWLGVGPGNYAVQYALYRLPRWHDALGHAHNVYLNVAGESGILGLAAYLILWIACLWQAARAAFHDTPFVAAVGAGVLGGLVHATVHNVFDNLWVQHIYLVLALLLGLLAVLTPRPAQRAEPSRSQSTYVPGC